MPHLVVFTNPNSRKNRGRTDQVERLTRAVGPWGEVVETRGLDELGPAVEAALARGASCLVADGGDGSLHWVLNQAEPARSGALPPLLPTNGGTVDFVAKRCGLSGRADAIVLRLTREYEAGRDPGVLQLDTLEVTGIHAADARPGAAPAGTPFRRLGFALAAGGVGQRFFDRYYDEPVLGAPAILRIVGRAIASEVGGRLPLPGSEARGRYARDIFRPTRARVCIDGEEVKSREHGAIHAGAFEVSLGGVFQVFPLAREAGVLHFQAGNVQPAEIIQSLPNLSRGGPVLGKDVVERGGHHLEVEAIDEPLRPVLDGEVLPALSRLEVRPGPSISVPRVPAR